MSKSNNILRIFLTIQLVCLISVCSLQATSMSGDTIPPIFINPPVNDTLQCDNGNPISALTNWLLNGGSAVATDNGDTVSVLSTLSLSEAIEALSNSSPCNNEGMIEVGFFGVDTCGNSSVDTLFASFFLEDNEVPELITNPENLIVVCNALSETLLNGWVSNTANATIEDNCASTLDIIYNWEDINGNSGQGVIGEEVDIDISREQCEWYVDVNFSVSDGCGNVIGFSARFSIEDNDPPGFTPEIEDITLSCLDTLPVPDLEAIDACDGSIEYTFTDVSTQAPDSTNCGFYNYTVTRTFLAEDACSNSVSQEQVITFQDTIAPFINFQDTITLDCEVFFGNNLNSFLSNWGDLCSDVLVTFSQSDVDVDLCEFQVERTWRVRDRCSNITEDIQIINVTRNNPPTLNTIASDLFIPCETTESYNEILQDWLINAGGASSSSSCTSIDFFAAIPGSYILDNPNTFPGLPVTEFDLTQCSGADSTFAHSVEVDFVFFDNCGNVSVTSASAHVVDEMPPEFTEPCIDSVFVMITDSCNATIELTPPNISDNCGDTESPKILSQTQEITSQNPGDVTVPVDTMLFAFENIDLSNIIQGGEVLITIELENVDADDATEDFDIIDENGIVIGTTPNTSNQCGDTTLVISDIPTGILSFWAFDGVIELTVAPAGVSTLAINDVCLNSSVTVSISYEVEVSAIVDFAYSLDQSPYIETPFGEPLLLNLDVGEHDLVYRYTDCGSNELLCSQVISLQDGSPPEVVCPLDTILFVENLETCQAAYFFDPDIMVMDDCGLSEENGLQYFVQGATTVELTPLDGSLDFVILESGSNDISIVAFDASGNKDTCTFEISVIDTLMPEAICQDIEITLLPNLESDVEITSEMIDLGSNDFCSDISYELDQSTIDCSFIDSVLSIEMTVTDASGNINSCISLVTVNGFTVEPSTSLGLCAGDTLYLSSNFPDSLSGVAYDFEWTGPDFNSNAVNPTIPNVSSDNNGIYSLLVIGPGGCTAKGELTFDISDLTVINIESNADLYCIDQSIFLTTEENQDADQYIWFAGPPGMEVAIDTTDLPSLETIATEGVNSFYVQLDYGFCLSSPSQAIEIDIQDELIVSATVTDTTLCTGGDVQFSVMDALAGVDYEWYNSSGDLVSTSSQLDLQAIDFSDEGLYQLVGKSGVCESDTFTINVEVVEGLQTPVINAENIFCTGSTISLAVQNEPDGSEYTWILNGNIFELTNTNQLTIPNATTDFSGLWQVSTEDAFCQSDTSQNFEISVEEEILIGASNNGPGCEGDSITLMGSFLPGASYTWTAPDNENYNGRVVTVPAIQGEYDLLVETEAGCTNTTSTFVEVNEAVMITALSNSSTQCMNVGDTIVFAASVFPPGDYIYQWTGPGFISDEETASIDSFTLANNGTYTLTVFNENCPSNESTTSVDAVLIPDKPELVFVSGSCEGDQLILESGEEIDGASYIWNTPSGQITSGEPTLTLPGAGLQLDGFYVLSLEIDNCLSPPSDTLTIDFGTLPDDPIIIANQDICVGDDLSLFVAEEASVYIWSGLVDTITTSGNLILPSVQSGGTISVQLQNQDCINEQTDEITVSVNAVPEPVLYDAGSIPECLDPGFAFDLCILNFEEGLSYSVINIFGDEIASSVDTCINIDASSLVSGLNTLYLFANAGNCRSIISDEITITSYTDEIQGAFVQEGSYTICDRNEQLLNAVMIPEGASINWTSTNELLTLSEDGNTVLVSDLQEGLNQVILTTDIGLCTDVFVDTIDIFTITGVKANDDIFSIPSNEPRIYDVIDNDQFDESVTITIIGQPSQGEAFVDNDKITYIPEAGFFGEVNIIYEICSEFCDDFCSRANLQITVGDVLDCTVPTIFTPNNDNINDALIIECLLSGEYPGNELLIFNQWGDEVYNAQPYQNDWEGLYSNKPLPVGTYYYIFDLGDGSRPMNGFIVLER